MMEVGIVEAGKFKEHVDKKAKGGPDADTLPDETHYSDVTNVAVVGDKVVIFQRLGVEIKSTDIPANTIGRIVLGLHKVTIG